jgi:hypothetical protein
MARKFGGDATRIRDDSVKRVTRALGIDARGWKEAERHSLEDWSLILAMIPGLANWSAEEKREMVGIIRAQSGTNEMRYLRLTQRHGRLREEILRLGSVRGDRF